ncbi:MAG: HAMP domain-containing histidine kinase [Desulfocapsa sp.]|nr:HAMP domain-containing histidine kinase [Desulfocapsa sp.]MBN4058599.1 HAMP domain-containing histidine kinase [Desulfocapsa sp. AH-315-J15]
MFFEYDLKRHRKDLTSDFSSEEITAIMDSAIGDLKNRNIAGVFIVPLAYIVGGFATDYAVEQSLLYAFLGFILLNTLAVRVLSIIALSKKVITKKHIWLPVFFWSNIIVGIVWATFTSTAILFYHNTLSITLIITLLAGISSGSMASYCIWKVLSYAYLLIILGVPTIAEFYIGNHITIPIGVAFTFFLVFNLVQTKILNKHYWQSLINTFKMEKNSLEMEALNIKLSDEIAGHKQTSQNIVISQKKLQDIYNSAHDGIFIFGLDGKAIAINDTMLKMFNVGRQKALKFDVNVSFQSTRNRNVDLKSIWKGAVNGNDQEFTWLTTSIDTDKISTVQVNLKKSLWGENSVIIATVRDISQQVAAMEATTAANKEKTEFLANMSHELRTPMHGILGYARLGLKRSNTVPRDKLEEYFQLISDSGKRLMELLNNVLDFSKLEVGKMRYEFQKNNLLPMIQEVTTELAPIAAEKGLYFDVHHTLEDAVAYCDVGKIMQVLRNLLFNAIKFSHENNQIKITCKEDNGNSGKQQLLVSVHNFGIQIPEDELSTIFEKFTQSTATNTGAGGTGLGLAISKQILNAHGGTIWAENAPDGLTVFRFLLPCEK